MKISDAFKLILKIEDLVDTEVFTWKDFKMWPLMRRILWFKLVSVSSINKADKNKNRLVPLVRFKNLMSKIYCSFKENKAKEDSEIIYFSRPAYLQEIKSQGYIDRIVDPLIYSLNDGKKTTKYYFSKIPKEKQLIYEYFDFYQKSPLKNIKISSHQKKVLFEISKFLDINSIELHESYANELLIFVGYYFSAKKLLENHKNLEEVYLACWYFSDAMGVCAAADELGIKTIDIQHGKQGKYQAMYSGWTKLPINGYALMPDSFWCWGQPSCEHILASSPNRKKHIPFIGGYPWIEYYKKNMLPVDSKTTDSKIRVLLTMQTPQAGNLERIPDFIIDFLSSSTIEDVHFTFRYHPNDIYGYHYCKERLTSIDPVLYSIDRGTQNLYDVFRVVTHHITAYSSCCYEASMFNVPTLLYGEESKEIYEDDINNHTFTWINSNEESLRAWLLLDSYDKPNTAMPYIDKIHN